MNCLELPPTTASARRFAGPYKAAVHITDEETKTQGGDLVQDLTAKFSSSAGKEHPDTNGGMWRISPRCCLVSETTSVIEAARLPVLGLQQLAM